MMVSAEISSNQLSTSYFFFLSLSVVCVCIAKLVYLLIYLCVWDNFSVVESGDDIQPTLEEGTRTLLLANHQSTADVPLFMACFNAKPDVLPNIMWIMDRVFKFTNFGIVSVLHRDFFVQAVSTSSHLLNS